MLKPPFPYRLRAMLVGDVPAIMKIEKTAFPKPWQASAYEYEVTKNQLASYQVVTVQEGDKPSQIIGYTGHWFIADEIHISTIAVHSKWRGRHLGELLLLNSLFLAYEYENPKAALATLEVRRSNLVAQNLYRKYRFELVGERKRYYQGNEDALIMTVEPLDRSYRDFLKQQWGVLSKQLAVEGSPLKPV
jgi:ribosomal-protein-alanine N-acetyltransferase